MEAIELSSVQEKELDYQNKVLAYLKKDQADKKQLAMRLQLLTLLFHRKPDTHAVLGIVFEEGAADSRTLPFCIFSIRE